MSNEFDFSDLKIIEVPVTGPNKKTYLLREASGDAVAKFNNARAKTAKMAQGEVVGVDGVGELECLLVSYCLYHASTSPDGTGLVLSDPPELEKLNTIRAWPSRVVSALYDKAKEISEIDMDDNLQSLYKQRAKLDSQIARMEKDSAKNEPDSSTSGSD